MEKLKSKEINAKWRNGQVSAMSTMIMASGMGSMHRYNQTQWWYIDPVGHFRMGWNIVLVCLFSTECAHMQLMQQLSTLLDCGLIEPNLDARLFAASASKMKKFGYKM